MMLYQHLQQKVKTTALPFQTEYLIIKGKEESSKGSLYAYKLDFPNFKVKNAFLSKFIKKHI
jgi:hypothetical protein